jgi:hypothetical protein
MRRALILALTSLLCTSCNKPAEREICLDDADCRSEEVCLEDGSCGCKNDNACATDEICNTSNRCQRRPACKRNSDCPEFEMVTCPENTICNQDTTFCDVATGLCVEGQSTTGMMSSAACTQNVHCGIGNVCDLMTRKCVEGCRDDGDCPLFSICERNQSSTENLGVCRSGGCRTTASCRFGETCTNDTCVMIDNPLLCKPCEAEPFGCGDPENSCLLNGAYDPMRPELGAEFFCAINCSGDPSICPSGYECIDNGISTGDRCEPLQHDQCCTGRDPSECCALDAQSCEGKRVCAASEGDTQGVCTCISDNDCILNPQLPSGCVGSCNGEGTIPCASEEDCPMEFPCSMEASAKVCQFSTGEMPQSCTMDSECEPTPFCVPSGEGGNVCIWSFGLESGTVPCETNFDCACQQPQGRCFGTELRCDIASDCMGLKCQGGQCITGKVCAPKPGLTCPELRSGP